ncbi:hypothetical protein FXF51_20270 [Nonomuraea sp. PA05]|uniref:hypothetical protein n=1 Tax=Nonomuraea sp. PA05 TaxID=2604466 RepID=UPI0011DB99FE|nr:hypothetical protein [Nonomuraea sp. PA05]TYB64791.1 hypothetical protein FXF51_20270 [Nonomuraea sp. PA05]
MNAYLPAAWAEGVFRLRLGVEPVDAVDPLREPGLTVTVLLEKVPLPHPVPDRPDDGMGLPALRRSRTGRFAVRFGSRVTDTAARLPIRIIDPAEQYVPRRLSVPAPLLADVLAADDLPAKPPRAHRPVLFPGRLRGLTPGTTALLGRVVRGSATGVPWARIEAGLAGTGLVRWRAHADRHGEFVLVVGELPVPIVTSRAETIDIDVSVYARDAVPESEPVESPSRSRADPLWLLPVEPVAALEAGDPVEAGHLIPAGYGHRVTTRRTLTRGRAVPSDPIVVT